MNTSNKVFIESSSHSKMTTFNFKHVWKIDHFSDKIVPKGDQILSPMISVTGHKDIKFQLQLFPQTKEDGKFISVYLACFCKKTIKSDIPTTFEIAFIRNDGFLLTHGEYKCTFTENKKSWGLLKFAEYSHIMNPMNNILHNQHQLVVCCKATVHYNRTQSESLPAKASNTKDKFKSNLKSLLDSADLSDFIIVVGETEIPVHKLILSAHSPVFKAMFSTHTKETQENKVNIPDVSVDVMKDFLNFIYFVKIDDDRLSLELLTLADKYQVDDLKSYCADHISSNLTVEKVANAYLIADMHNAEDLKADCLTFITNNFKQVSITEGYELLCKSGGEKMVTISHALSKLL